MQLIAPLVPLALATALVLVPTARTAGAAPAPRLLPSASAQDAAPSSGDLHDAADLAVRWLRLQQERETGAYGTGVDSTTAVLVALASSPRQYRPGDGPFIADAVEFLFASQRADGAFAAQDASTAAAQVSTNSALDALALLGVTSVDREGAADELERARTFLGDARRTVLGGPPELALPAAMDLASTLLSTQAADGSWNPGPAALVSTAGRLTLLSGAYRTLKAAEPKLPARDVVALPPFDPATRVKAEAAMERGAQFLLRAADDGLWGAPGQPDAGITSMVVGALTAVPEPRPAEVQAALDRALDWLRSLQQPDGSIHQGRLANYVTSAAVLALARTGREEDVAIVARARDFLVALQADEGDGYSSEDRYYGGVGYGGDERPDLSNLQLALEALSAAGLDPGDEAFQKALRFLERSQNRSESNDLVIEQDGSTIRSGDDGGASYAPGESKAGFLELADGSRVPRSYGSMTYALLKGYLFAGLDREDPRVQSAWKWLMANYTLDVNPGFEASSDPTAAYQGLFYYFYTMARALDLYGEERIVDAAEREHFWRTELAGRLVAMQRQDGSWLNTNSPRWWEGNPVLATSYALLTLDAALPPAASSDSPAD